METVISLIAIMFAGITVGYLVKGWEAANAGAIVFIIGLVGLLLNIII